MRLGLRERGGLFGQDLVDLREALGAGLAQIGLRRLGGALGLQRGDLGAQIGHHGGRGRLADRHPRRRGIQERHRLVGQLPRRQVARRERDGGHHRLVGDAHPVMRLHRREDAAQHGAGPVDRRLVDIDRLEAAGERRVLLEMLAVFRPGGGGDGAQRAARQRRFEQVGRVARARGAAGADERVRLVDEQDDRVGLCWTSSMTERRRCSNSPFIEAPACISPISSACSRTPRSAGGTRPATSACAKPSTTAVLPTPASPVRIGLFWRRRISTSMIWRISSSRPTIGSILPLSACAVMSMENRPSAVCPPGRALFARCGARRPEAAAIHRAHVLLVRVGPDGARVGHDLVGVERRHQRAEIAQRAGQIAGAQDRHQRMARADLRLAEEQRGVVPAAVERIGELRRDARHLGHVAAKPGDGLVDIGLHAARDRCRNGAGSRPCRCARWPAGDAASAPARHCGCPRRGHGAAPA